MTKSGDSADASPGADGFAGQFFCWLARLGLTPQSWVALRVCDRVSGRMRQDAVVIPTVAGHRYVVSMFGAISDWVQNLEAANGDAVISHGGSVRVRASGQGCPRRTRADPPRVCSRRIERSETLSAAGWRTAGGVRRDCFAVPCVPNRGASSLSCPAQIFLTATKPVRASARSCSCVWPRSFNAGAPHGQIRRQSGTGRSQPPRARVARSLDPTGMRSALHPVGAGLSAKTLGYSRGTHGRRGKSRVRAEISGIILAAGG